MNDLVTWLRTQLDDDERVARRATAGPWSVDDENYAETIYAADGHTTVVAGGRWGGEASVFTETADALHIARHNPARVLAEIATKRRILELHRPDRALENWYWLQRACAECGKQWHRWIPNRLPTDIGPEVGCPTLRLLALPYADQPGYDESWRP